MATVTNKELLTICSLTNAFPARSEMAILNQINGLISQGHQVTVFAEGCDPQASQLEKKVCEKRPAVIFIHGDYYHCHFYYHSSQYN